MRVILLKDIENIGKKYDVKEVKDGYARNFLIPKGLAKPVTKKILEWLEIQKEVQEKKAEQELKKIQGDSVQTEEKDVLTLSQIKKIKPVEFKDDFSKNKNQTSKAPDLKNNNFNEEDIKEGEEKNF